MCLELFVRLKGWQAPNLQSQMRWAQAMTAFGVGQVSSSKENQWRKIGTTEVFQPSKVSESRMAPFARLFRTSLEVDPGFSILMMAWSEGYQMPQIEIRTTHCT